MLTGGSSKRGHKEQRKVFMRLCKWVLRSGENGVKKYREHGAWEQGAGSMRI